VHVVRYQCPGITLSLGFRQKNGKPFKEALTVFIIIEYPPALYSSDDDMMQEAGCVESGYPWHALLIAMYVLIVNYLII
jgi:hypothetical protein